MRALFECFWKRKRGLFTYFRRIPINECTDNIAVGSLAGYIGEAMGKPPFSLAFVMVKESVAVPAIFFYQRVPLTKDRGGQP